MVETGAQSIALAGAGAAYACPVPPLTATAYDGLAAAFLEVMRRRNPGLLVMPAGDGVSPMNLALGEAAGKSLSEAA
jgi:hypothetical protein